MLGLWIALSVSCADQEIATTSTQNDISLKSKTLLKETDCETISQSAIPINGKLVEFPKLQKQMFGDKGPVKIWEDLDIFNNGNTVTLISHELPLRTHSDSNTKDLFLDLLYVVYDQKLLPTESDLLNFHRFLASLKLSQKDSQNPKNAGSDVLFFTNFPVSIQLLDKTGNHVNNPISQFSDNNNHSRERFDLGDYLATQNLTENAIFENQSSSNPLKGRQFAKIDLVEIESVNLLKLKLYSPTNFSHDQFKNTFVLFLKLEKTKSQKIGARIICSQK